MAPTPHHATGHSGLREMARRPRDSDGVGSALRHIFGGANCGMPTDFRSLLSHLDKTN